MPSPANVLIRNSFIGLQSHIIMPQSFAQHGRITAVLGPTNTGKTHLAIERMLAHNTGIIGLPLRLLAREVYDRVVERTGPAAAALITGEEKIVPARARYFICTVEAMPRDTDAEFLAVDEIQLAADPERGHIFTRRLLGARGRLETMLLGSDTMHEVINALLPDANFVSRPRFSQLAYSGRKKISRLPRRSAIVAFSTDNVYAIAELIRRQRGGAAVVMGALSPRTRNAQVALYQSGDVDFLVATDAIGMGLNMDIDHVAFAGTGKFDGHAHRPLTPAEFAQIAGRAGRHMNDGTFGETGDATDLDANTISRIENHDFDSLNVLQWRNTDLDYSSLAALRASLDRPPGHPRLIRTRISTDQAALETLSGDDDIAARITTPAAVQLLWDICQLPDYRKISRAEHAGLIGRLFAYLHEDGRIPGDWFEKQIRLADNMEGNLDTLAGRIAYIRTWTFVANRSGWLDDAASWRQKARDVEDRLSDALHENLTRRFVDRRTSVLMKRLRERQEWMAAIDKDGTINVEGETVGRLDGFAFTPAGSGADARGKAIQAAAAQILAGEIPARAEALARAANSAITLNREGIVLWRGSPVAHLVASDDALSPGLKIIAGDQLNGPDLEKIETRLKKWLETHIGELLAPLLSLRADEELTGNARGLAFRLQENFGVVDRDDVAGEVRSLDQDTRAKIRRHGVRFGAFSIYIPPLLKPAATHLRHLLWKLRQPGVNTPPLPADGLTSVPVLRDPPQGFYATAGFRACGPRAVRVDMLERLADAIRPIVFWKPDPDKPDERRPEGSVEGGGFTLTPAMMSYLGCSGEDLGGVLRALGYRCERRELPPEPMPTPAPAKDKTRETAPAPGTGDEKATAETTRTDPQPTARNGNNMEAAKGTAGEKTAPGAMETPGKEAAGKNTPDGNGAAGDAEKQAEPEPRIIEIWRPARRSPARPRRPARTPDRSGNGTSSRPQKPGGKKTVHDKARPRPHKARPDRPAPRRDREPDPDSPFAALAALKAEMNRKRK